MSCKRTAQKNRVLQYLKVHGSITSMDAINCFGATRLSAIIFDLRHDGWNIETKFEKGCNRFGNETRYGRYYLRPKT